MTKLITTRGLPGSGKSTWALNRVKESPAGQVVRVSRDDLREMLHGGEVFDQSVQDQITLVELAVVEAAFRSEAREVIVDRTNTNHWHLEALRVFAGHVADEFEVVDFSHVTVEECLRRMASRPTHRRVPEDRMWEMYREMTGE